MCLNLLFQGRYLPRACNSQQLACYLGATAIRTHQGYTGTVLTGAKGRPSSGRPPSNDKPKQSTKARAAGFSSPEIDGPS
jgi:hypothetical protein